RPWCGSRRPGSFDAAMTTLTGVVLSERGSSLATEGTLAAWHYFPRTAHAASLKTSKTLVDPRPCPKRECNPPASFWPPKRTMLDDATLIARKSDNIPTRKTGDS